MWQNFTGWLRRPFDAEQDAFRWFLFFGLLIVIMAAWRIILAHIFAGIR